MIYCLINKTNCIQDEMIAVFVDIGFSEEESFLPTDRTAGS